MQYSKSHRLTCVTLDGDIVERKGGVEGGWVDKDAGRLVRTGPPGTPPPPPLHPEPPHTQVHVAKMYGALETVTRASEEIERLKQEATEADQVREGGSEGLCRTGVRTPLPPPRCSASRSSAARRRAWQRSCCARGTS